MSCAQHVSRHFVHEIHVSCVVYFQCIGIHFRNAIRAGKDSDVRVRLRVGALAALAKRAFHFVAYCDMPLKHGDWRLSIFLC